MSVNKLRRRTEHEIEKIVVNTFPKTRYNINNIEKHMEYCYYNLIKYSIWDKKDLPLITNKHTAIERWNEFIKTCPIDILNSLEYEIINVSFLSNFKKYNE